MMMMMMMIMWHQATVSHLPRHPTHATPRHQTHWIVQVAGGEECVFWRRRCKGWRDDVRCYPCSAQCHSAARALRFWALRV